MSHQAKHAHTLRCSVRGCDATAECRVDRTKLPTSGRDAEQMMVQLYMIPISAGWRILDGKAECPDHSGQGPTEKRWELYARLCKAGWGQSAVARACGVTRAAVSYAVREMNLKGERA